MRMEMPGVDFADYFWVSFFVTCLPLPLSGWISDGEKNEGFSVLQGCLKSCPLSAKELDTSKAQLKILKQLSGSPPLLPLQPARGGAPSWPHGHLERALQAGLQIRGRALKKHKSLKEESSSTAEVVKSFLELTAQLNKSKELYKAKCLELNTKAPSKSGDKADLKFRKAQEDYKGLDRLATYARLCQEMETAHVSQMREFVSGYFSEVREYGRRLAKNNEDFYADLEELSVAHLLTLFTNTYQTGLEKPGKRNCHD
ncbi:Uncharacterized protein FKW44_022734 [Caligus rogercresseyi]|uniref:F-BAR domain-containing protein n=1 Tax=Caligus rogercresseyi TaxID=217165 RepID=A0A7T8GNB9_CALRO|nr:Uncharacterized protein FKW44_022734 [Caligus rogercresseyi]